MSFAGFRIGIDFDNTIVGYDDVMCRLASERGLIGGSERTKRAVRDRIRQRPGGEIEWQKVQALAYGPRMAEAVLLEGADEFIRRCRRAGMAVFNRAWDAPANLPSLEEVMAPDRWLARVAPESQAPPAAGH